MKRALLIIIVTVSLFFGAVGQEIARLSLLANPEIADSAGWVHMRQIVTRRYPLANYTRGGLLPAGSTGSPSEPSTMGKAALNFVTIQLLTDKPWRLKWEPGLESLVFNVGWSSIANGQKEEVEFIFHHSWITALPLEKWGINIVRKPFLESATVFIHSYPKK